LRLRALCFVLITSVLDAEEHPAEKVPRDYKEQTAVELQFRAIKEPEFVGAIIAKKPERLEALACVVLLAADAVIAVILPNGSRVLSESTMSRDKMFRALGVSPSVYVTIPRKTRDPENSEAECVRVLKMECNIWQAGVLEMTS
jgi:hypothetical protein